MSSLAQRVGRNPLPEGTLAVGAGLVLAGVAQYGFLAVSARALGSAHYAPLATFCHSRVRISACGTSAKRQG